MNFKVMKTFRNQLNHLIGLQLPMLLQKNINTCSYTIFYAVKKKQKYKEQRFNYNLSESAVEAVKPNFGPQKMFIFAFFEHK